MPQAAGLGGSVRGEGLPLSNLGGEVAGNIQNDRSTTSLIDTVEIVFAFKVQWLQYHLLGIGKYPGVVQGWYVSDAMHVKSNVT
ncbi:hypothetical protein N7481_011083 [Penicillium waksmanii]|uniref:uncharacterized protein n=1 Tax=Penicillium waksmanii TaxID=69791 RepID=UPI0025470394|nr:uncharacterized protein N7481_011083 [Penicillium waksmanii]KAJ5973873.1 hypothetical protein N7481_011083 [Penicillium waksmanii]